MKHHAIRITLAIALTITAANAAELSLTPNQPPDKTTLQWDPSPDTDVTGYAIFYGTAPGEYTKRVDVGKVLTYSITGLERGKTYYFAATAYDADGLESNFSNEVSKHVKPIPKAPATLQDPAVVKVAIETSTSPKGPWKSYADIEVGSAPIGETYFRSKVDIEAKPVEPRIAITAPPVPPGS